MIPASRRTLASLARPAAPLLARPSSSIVAPRAQLLWTRRGAGIRAFSRCGTAFAEAALRAPAQHEAPPPAEEVHDEDDAAAGPKGFHSLEANLHKPLFSALVNKPFHYKLMSPVQAAVLSLLPDLVQPIGSTPSSPDAPCPPGADIMVKAKTGTGKTLAFLVPAVEARLRDIEAEEARFDEQNPDATSHEMRAHLQNYKRSTTGVLILSPTRELATQIANEAVRVCSHLKDVQVRLFVGGSSKGLQLREWNRGVRDIVVATPGRMLDVMTTIEDVSKCVAASKVLIFDEADTLLEMGFKDEIDQIVNHLRPKEERQTFLFSATISKDIQKVARMAMKQNPHFIDCVPDGESNTHDHIPQKVTVLPSPEDQILHVCKLIAHDQLTNISGGKAIIFLPTTKATQLFARIMINMKSQFPWGVTTGVHEIHGQRTQEQRTRAAAAFRGAKDGYNILVTSDVSARGVDYPGVTRVIQVGIPTTRDIYIHRVGRTGRAGKGGRGDLVLLPWEAGYMKSELRGLPLESLSVEAESEALTLRAREFDQSNVTPTTTNQRGKQTMPVPVSQRLEAMNEHLKKQVLPALDEESVDNAFGAMVGFYISRSSELFISKENIVQGIKDWAVGALGLEQAPHLSPAFLARLGVRPGGSRSGGGSGMRRGSESRFHDFRVGRSGDDGRSNDRRSGGSSFGYGNRNRDDTSSPQSLFGADGVSEDSSSYRGGRPSFGYENRSRSSFSRDGEGAAGPNSVKASFGFQGRDRTFQERGRSFERKPGHRWDGRGSRSSRDSTSGFSAGGGNRSFRPRRDDGDSDMF